jgi:methionine aminotransferase
VAAIPISTFYSEGKDLKKIRFCFPKDNATLKEAARRLFKVQRLIIDKKRKSK